MKTLRLFFATAAMVLLSTPAWAVLVGSSVTGTLQFSGVGNNYFDPAFGSVPMGTLNNAGITVTISAVATEFGYTAPDNIDLADFTTTQLIVTDAVSGGAGPWKMTFTSSAFTGITLVSSNFPGLTASFANNTITLNWGGTGSIDSISGIGGAPGVITYTAIYNVNTPGAVPDGGSTALLLGLMLVAVALFTRHFQPKPARVSVRR